MVTQIIQNMVSNMIWNMININILGMEFFSLKYGDLDYLQYGLLTLVS
jgi:hypothetical protein